MLVKFAIVLVFFIPISLYVESLGLNLNELYLAQMGLGAVATAIIVVWDLKSRKRTGN